MILRWRIVSLAVAFLIISVGETAKCQLPNGNYSVARTNESLPAQPVQLNLSDQYAGPTLPPPIIGEPVTSQMQIAPYPSEDQRIVAHGSKTQPSNVASAKEKPKQPPKDFKKAVMKAHHPAAAYNNNFDYLLDSDFSGPYYFGDQFKHLWYNKLDIGGEIRSRYHREQGIRGLGLTGRDDNFWLTRGRLYADYEVNKNVRLYGEYLYADSGGETFNNRPIEENRNEIQNLFVDLRLPELENGSINVRLGRQELFFGAQRLVSTLDWANTRISFQGARATYKRGKFSLDAFLVNPLNRNASNESQIDSANDNIVFYGSYATFKQSDGTILDFYLLGQENTQLNFNNQTIGSRIVGKTDRFLYEAEGGFQFGSNSDGTGHDAAFVTFGVGKELDYFCSKPKLWFWYDWASGGDESFVGRGDDSFDHQFPLAHKYLGFADLFSRRNINDANIQLIAPLADRRFKFVAWYHYLFLHEKTTPYNVNLTPFNTTALAGDRELGHEIDLLCVFQPNPRHRFTAGYTQFFSGNYYNTTPGVPTTGDGSLLFTEYQIRF